MHLRQSSRRTENGDRGPLRPLLSRLNVTRNRVGLRKTGLQLAKWSLFVLVLVFVSRYVERHWDSIAEARWVFPQWLFVGSAIALLSMLVSARGYQRLIAAQGCTVRYHRVLGLSYVPMLGKYIPGKLWSLVAALHLYGRVGVPRPVAIICVTVYMALGIGSAVVIVLALGLVSPASGLRMWPYVLMAGLLVPTLYPPVLYGATNTVLRALGRRAIVPAMSVSEVLKVLAILVAAKVVYGSGFFFVILSFRDVPWAELPDVIAFFTLAQVAGLMALFAPAGIGVREGVLLVGLQPIVGPGSAIAITGVCRLWQTGMELLMAAVGWVGLRNATRSDAAS